MRDVVTGTIARIQCRVQEDRDKDTAFGVVEDPGHDDPGQDCQNDQKPHLHKHGDRIDFLIENLPRDKEERQVKQGPQWTEHQAGAPSPEALLQVGNREARPAPFFPDLYGNTNDQDVWQVHREEEWPVLEKRHV